MQHYILTLEKIQRNISFFFYPVFKSIRSMQTSYPKYSFFRALVPWIASIIYLLFGNLHVNYINTNSQNNVFTNCSFKNVLLLKRTVSQNRRMKIIPRFSTSLVSYFNHSNRIDSSGILLIPTRFDVYI
jgi:hypothetical protein